MTGGAGCWDDAWSAALGAMELELDEVERMLRTRDVMQAEPVPAAPFQPPPGLGPLPVGLADRARRLLQRQLDVSHELTVAIAGNRQQARLVSRLHRERPDAEPVFVDNRG